MRSAIQRHLAVAAFGDEIRQPAGGLRNRIGAADARGGKAQRLRLRLQPPGQILFHRRQHRPGPAMGKLPKRAGDRHTGGQREPRMAIVYLAIIGAAAGFIATRLMRLNTDLVTTIAIGVFGALIGGLVLRLLLTITGVAAGFLGAVLGAMLLIWLWRTYGPHRR